MGSLYSAEPSAKESRETNNVIFLIPLIRTGWLFKRQFNSFKYLFNSSFWNKEHGASLYQASPGSSCNPTSG